MSCEFTVGTMNRSIRYFGFVQMPDPPLPYIQMFDPQDTSWCQIPTPAGIKAGQMPRGCLGGCSSFDLIDALQPVNICCIMYRLIHVQN